MGLIAPPGKDYLLRGVNLSSFPGKNEMLLKILFFPFPALFKRAVFTWPRYPKVFFSGFYALQGFPRIWLASRVVGVDETRIRIYQV
jgi:hypothetical protein